MSRISLFVTIAFLAGLGIGIAFFARSARPATLERSDARAADLAAIEKLHKADVDATLTQDPSAMTALWSEDGVKLDADGPPVVGIKALGEMYAKFRIQYPEFKVLKYVPEFTDVQIAGGWAIEVGYVEATFKMPAKEEPVVVPRTQGVRVLKRQSDGSWKFAVVGLK